MKKALSILIILIFSNIKTFGQVDNMKNEILNYQNEKSTIISNGRKMIIDKIIVEDKQKIAELSDYLNKQEDKDYLAFYPIEKWLIYYWTQQYQPLLKDIAAYNNEYSNKVSKQIKPQNDLLSSKLREKISEHRHEIKSQINLSELSNEEKSFLTLNLDYLISNEYNKYITQDDLNYISNDFLKSYPSSAFTTYVKTYIRNEYVTSKWGFGYEIFLGYGMFTDNLAKKFNNNGGFGFNFDAAYNDFTLYLRAYIGISKTKDDLNFNGVIWNKGTQANVVLPEASLGYAIHENKKLKVSPFVGISSMDISPVENDIRQHPEYDKVGLKFTTTYTLGLNLDFKLGQTKLGPSSYGLIRVRYSFNNPQFHGNYSGNFHCLTVGFGGFAKKVSRVQ